MRASLAKGPLGQAGDDTPHVAASVAAGSPEASASASGVSVEKGADVNATDETQSHDRAGVQPTASELAPAHPPAGEAPSPQALLADWYRRYPQTFFKGHTQPLKVGIHEDLAAREPWAEKLVRRALACYVHLPRYLKAVREGAGRVDLDGRPAGVVNADEALHARQQLEVLQARQQQRQQEHKRKAESRKSARLDQKLSDLLAKHGR
ncbi:MAG: ProQ/FINO family protein [Halomonas sp.]|nr:ProQ/FINO family protein [Halomonas sp.]